MQIRSNISNLQGYIRRYLEQTINQDLTAFPAVGILGPRQCGKTTLAKALGNSIEGFSYLDFERPSDIRKIDDPELFFSVNKDALVCLDAIQNKPELFPVLRSILDESAIPGQQLV